MKHRERILETETGDLLATQPRRGSVVLLTADRDGDGQSDATLPLLDDLEQPHGMALRDGWLKRFGKMQSRSLRALRKKVES